MSDNTETKKDSNRLQDLLARFKGRSIRDKIWMLIAFVFYVIFEPFRQLYLGTYKVEDGFDGFRKLLGTLTALGMGIGQGYALNALSQPAAWQNYLPLSLGMAVLGFYAILPLFYLKAWKNDTFLWKTVDREKYVDSDGKVRTRHEKSWLTHLLLFVSHAGAIVGGFWGAIALGNTIFTAMPNFLGGLVAFVAGLIGLIIGVAALWTIAGWLELRLYSLAAGAFASLAAVPYINGLELPSYASAAALFATFVAVSGYVVPAVHNLVGRGLKELIVQMSKVYNEEDRNYRTIFEHTFTILESTYLARAVVCMTGALAWGWQSTIGVVVFILSYLFVGQWVASQRTPKEREEKRVNRDSLRSASTLVSLHYGWFQGASYLAGNGHDTLGIVGAIGGGLVHAALCYLLFFPLAYVSIRFFLKPLAHPAIGKFLVTMYDEVVKAFDKVDEMRKDVYSSKPSDVKTLVQHLSTFAATAGVGFGVNALTVKYAIPASQVITGISVAVSYLLVGHALTKEKIPFFGRNANGMTVLGMLAGLSTGLATGVAVLGASSMPFAIILGLLVASVTTAWLFPIIFGLGAAVLMTVAPRATRFFSETFASVHGFCWSKFQGFVTNFVKAYKAIREGMKKLGQAFRESYQAIKEEFDRLFGRTPKGKDDSENDE